MERRKPGKYFLASSEVEEMLRGIPSRGSFFWGWKSKQIQQKRGKKFYLVCHDPVQNVLFLRWELRRDYPASLLPEKFFCRAPGLRRLNKISKIVYTKKKSVPNHASNTLPYHILPAECLHGP